MTNGNNKFLLLVIISGPTDFNLETVAINYNGVWLNRVILPKKKD